MDRAGYVGTEGFLMDAVIYTRVSAPRQVSGVSLTVQQQDCERLARAHGDTIVRVLVDPGYSAKSLSRPAMQELLALLEADGAGAVYVWSIDRFSRDLIDQIAVARELVERGQRLVSVRQNIDYSTASGRVHLHIMASLAQYEREQLAERVAAAHLEKIERGEPLQMPPLGYVTHDGVWSVDPEAAATVRLVFRLYNSGESLTGIARFFNETGVPSGHGGRWTAERTGGILRNQAYIGILQWGEHVYEADHEQLVSRDVWQRTQARLERRATVHPRTLDRSLSCCYVCGECGSRINRQVGGAQRSYVCAARRLSQRTVHPDLPVSVSAPATDAVVWAHVRELFAEGDIDAGAEALSEAMRDADARTRRQELARELADVEQRIRRNLEAYHAEAIDVALLREQNAPLQARQSELEGALEREAALVEGPSPSALRRLTRGSIDAALSTENIDRQQQLLELLFHPIEIGADRIITIRARWPSEPVRYALPRYYSPQRGCLFDLANLRL